MKHQTRIIVTFRMIMEPLLAILSNNQPTLPPGESNSMINLTKNELFSSGLLSAILLYSSVLSDMNTTCSVISWLLTNTEWKEKRKVTERGGHKALDTWCSDQWYK